MRVSVSGFRVWNITSLPMVTTRILVPRAPRIATSGKVQFSEHAQRIRFTFSANQIFRFESEHAQSDGKSVNRALPVLDFPRGRESWCWPKRARPLETRMDFLVLRKGSHPWKSHAPINDTQVAFNICLTVVTKHSTEKRRWPSLGLHCLNPPVCVLSSPAGLKGSYSYLGKCSSSHIRTKQQLIFIIHGFLAVVRNIEESLDF